MQIVEELKKVEAYAQSEDGVIYKRLENLTPEERQRALQDIKDYESTAKGVLFNRLASRGVIKELVRHRTTEPDEKLTPEQNKFNSMMLLLDCLMDDGMGRSAYYVFTPVTEQDIKDLVCYAKLAYDCGVDGANANNEYYRTDNNIKTGETYIFQVNSDCEWCSFMSPKHLAERVAKMSAFYEDMGKTQRKSLK